MNTFWLHARKYLVLVCLWWIALTIFVGYRVAHAGVVPTFPYYALLTEQTDRAHAVWGHFDGVHYLKLAAVGYVDIGTQAFFPVYPLMIRGLHQFGIAYMTAGRLISFVCLYMSLLCLPALFGKRAPLIAAVLLAFPTSFFFAAIYTESLFFCETLFFFLFLSRKRFFWAALVAGLASGTRIVGSLLTISLCIELLPLLRHHKKYLLLIPLSLTGVGGYMLFLAQKFGDPLMFIHVQSMFGAGRTGGTIILLPQVLYRYGKILLTVPPQNIVWQRALLEAVTFLGALGALWSARKKYSAAVMWYLFGSLLVPTVSGTLSSLPRYALVLVPWLIPGQRIGRLTGCFIVGSAIGLLLLVSVFAYGQFVA